MSLLTTINPAPAGHFVLHTAALHARPFDGYTLKPVIEAMQASIGIEPKRIYVDKGYQRYDYPKSFVFLNQGKKEGSQRPLKKN